VSDTLCQLIYSVAIDRNIYDSLFIKLVLSLSINILKIMADDVAILFSLICQNTQSTYTDKAD